MGMGLMSTHEVPRDIHKQPLTSIDTDKYP